jgi:hypothetical protein
MSRFRLATLVTLLVVTALTIDLTIAQPGEEKPQDEKQAKPKRVPLAEEHRPSPIPDRIVLTIPTTDPATTQAVTWRTDTSVQPGQAVARLVKAEDGPNFDPAWNRQVKDKEKPKPRWTEVVAKTEPFKSNLGEAHYHSVVFEELQPKTKYLYSVGDGVNWSEWIQFETASNEPEPFSFIYLGDAQNDIKMHWSRVIRQAYADAPKARLVIHAGDLINSANNDHEWGEWFRSGGWIHAMIPCVPTPGNHEYASPLKITLPKSPKQPAIENKPKAEQPKPANPAKTDTPDTPKEPKDSKDAKDSKEAKDVKELEPKDGKDAKNGKEPEPKDTKVIEPKEPKDAKDTKDTKDTKDVKELEPKDSKDAKDSKEAKDVKELEPKDGKDAKNGKEPEPKDTKVIEPKEPKDAKDTKDTKDVKELEPKDSKEAKEPEPKEPKDAKEIKQPEPKDTKVIEPKEPKDGKDAKDTKDVKELEPKDAKDAKDGKEPEPKEIKGEEKKDAPKKSRLSQHWRPQFTLPPNGPEGLEETVYYFDFQGVRFISLNSNERQAEQVAWLKKVLDERPASITWTVITFHHPILSTAKGRDNKTLRELWQPIFEEYGIDLVLTGHDHTYGRSGTITAENVPTGVRAYVGGVVYVVSVSGPKMYVLDRQPWMRRTAQNTQLYQIIHVRRNGVLVYEARTATGELYDSFELHKTPGGRNRFVEHRRDDDREPWPTPTDDTVSFWQKPMLPTAVLAGAAIVVGGVLGGLSRLKPRATPPQQ